MSFKSKLATHLRVHGYITPALAFAVYGKFNGLAQRIMDLRDEGWEIDTNVEIDDDGKRYPRYVLTGAPSA